MREYINSTARKKSSSFATMDATDQIVAFVRVSPNSGLDRKIKFRYMYTGHDQPRVRSSKTEGNACRNSNSARWKQTRHRQRLELERVPHPRFLVELLVRDGRKCPTQRVGFLADGVCLVRRVVTCGKHAQSTCRRWFFVQSFSEAINSCSAQIKAAGKQICGAPTQCSRLTTSRDKRLNDVACTCSPCCQRPGRSIGCQNN